MCAARTVLLQKERLLFLLTSLHFFRHSGITAVVTVVSFLLVIVHVWEGTEQSAVSSTELLRLVTGIGQKSLIQGHLQNQALGPPACYQAEYRCAWDKPYAIIVWSFVVMVRIWLGLSEARRNMEQEIRVAWSQLAIECSSDSWPSCNMLL